MPEPCALRLVTCAKCADPAVQRTGLTGSRLYLRAHYSGSKGQNIARHEPCRIFRKWVRVDIAENRQPLKGGNNEQ